MFKDPVGIAKGVDSIKAQFNGLAKVRFVDLKHYCIAQTRL